MKLNLARLLPGMVEIQVVDADGQVLGTSIACMKDGAGKVFTNATQIHLAGVPAEVRVCSVDGDVLICWDWSDLAPLKYGAGVLGRGDTLAIHLDDVFAESPAQPTTMSTPSYRVGKVSYENFGPFGDSSLDFSVLGLTGIDGVIEWKKGADSNGAGKSMLFEGVAWCLFGRCIRESFKGDDVVRIGSAGGCRVSAEIVGGKDLIQVVRYRLHPTYKNRLFLYVGGEDVSRGTDPETQHAIEDQLGIDFHTFCNAVAFGAREDVRSFFAATDAQRKAVLERMLGLELYAKAQQVAKQRLAEVTKVATTAHDKLVSTKAKLEQAVTHAEAADSYGDLETLYLAKAEAALRVKARKKTLLKATGTVDKAKADLKLAKQAEQAEVDAWNLEVEEIEQQRAAVQKKIAQLKGLAVQANTEFKVAKTRRAKLEGLGSECPTCEQTVADDVKADLVADLVAQAHAADEARNAALQKASEQEAKLDELVSPEFVPSAQVLIANTDLDVSMVAMAEAKGALQEALASAKGAVALWENASQHKASNTAAVEKLTATLEKVQGEYDLAQYRIARVQFWVEGFGNSGLKSFLIEAAIPDLNARATKYAQALLGSGASVKLTATTTLKSKVDAVREKLGVEGSIPGCCSTYAGASKGQKRRLDLALLLAFREVIAERSMTPFDQFFADELFDGLDKTGCECVAALLQELAVDRPVALVTHSPWLKSSVDRLVTVRHVHEFEAIVEVPKSGPEPGKKTFAKKKLLASKGKSLKAKLARKPGM